MKKWKKIFHGFASYDIYFLFLFDGFSFDDLKSTQGMFI